MTRKLLTIAIPTFNRSRHLALLLDVLATELRGLEDHVELLVLDNASTDDTEALMASFIHRYPACRLVRHAHNIGSAPNFLACFNSATARYFWMIGDDDVPVQGILIRIIDLLRREAPDLVYLDSHSAEDIFPLVSQFAAPAGGARVMGKNEFIHRTHVYLTFISAVIVDRVRLLAHYDVDSNAVEMGRNFVQLSWTLGALKYGEKFAVFEGACLLATSAGRSGYAALTVFGYDFPRVVRCVLDDSREANTIVRCTVAWHLPALVWSVRNGTAGDFEQEDPWPAMRRQLGHRPLFWVLVVPLGRFPQALAAPIYCVWRVVSRLHRDFGRLAAKLRDGVANAG